MSAGFAASASWALTGLWLSSRDGIALIPIPLSHATGTVLPISEVRHVELWNRNADEIFPLAADQLAVGNIFPQILANFSANDLLEATSILVDAEHHDATTVGGFCYCLASPRAKMLAT